MKVALITDQHWGARNDSAIFSEYFGKFYREFFFPIIDREGIRHVIDLGDTFDKRKHVAFTSLKASREHWFDELQKRDIHLDCIVGNHCTAFKNTNDVNSPDLLLRDYKNVRVYSEAEEVFLYDLPVAFIPWICTDNYNSTMDFLDKTQAQVIFGHLEIAGFEMYRGTPSDHGFDSKLFGKFDTVYSGHFHHKSSRGNISYLGAPYEMNWSDFNDSRGFHIFDTETRELTYFENPFKMFNRLDYDDAKTDITELLSGKEYLSGSHVKVYVKNKMNPAWFDKFIDMLEGLNLVSFQIIDDYNVLDLVEDVSDSDLEDGDENTLTLLKRVVDQVEVRVDKDRLSKFMTHLYHDAISVE